ncbi:MAG: D-alanine--D-alanine ligase, partial [Clostridiales bacterium]|nr:D-alanine--D-alanine ligase [Clostridiales bacterium]
MKIVVLAGGLSDERNVSLSSGVLVSEALRGRGHQVALVDLYLGIEDETQSLKALLQAPLPEHWKKVSR